MVGSGPGVENIMGKIFDIGRTNFETEVVAPDFWGDHVSNEQHRCTAAATYT